MPKRSFSLIEIIFTIAIISILAIVTIPKLQNSLTKTTNIKIKSDIMLIKDALYNYKTKYILSNETTTIESLDDNNKELFSKILKYPIISNSSQKLGTWEKLANDRYIVWIEDDQPLEFIYDKSNITFDCDHTNSDCQNYTQ